MGGAYPHREAATGKERLSHSVKRGRAHARAGRTTEPNSSIGRQ